MGDVELYDAGGAAANAAGDSAHLADTVDAHDASAISYAGANGLSATEVEGALDELDLEKFPYPHPLKPTAAMYENIARMGYMATQSVLTTQRQILSAIYLPAGKTITSISFISGGTAAVNPTNQWFTLYDNALALLKQTTDDLTAAWGANALKTLSLSSTHLTTYSGLYYVGIMVKADTVPNLVAIGYNSTLAGRTPIVTGIAADTGLTTTAPNPSGALTATSVMPYCYVS